MFTGIVQHLAAVLEVEDDTNLRRIRIDLPDATRPELGASIAINGTCLTVTRVTKSDVCFDVIAQTLANTNLGTLQPGHVVNFERSYRVGDEVGGHILSGHITGRATLADLTENQNQRDLVFNLDPTWLRYVFNKGFIALDGASLTVADVDRTESRITVCLIPETIARTTLGTLKPGDRVNVELDSQTQAVVETVERVLAERELA